MDQLAQLGIDPWGIFLYLIVIGVLLAVLSKFLYRPLLKFLDERQALIKKSVEDAEGLRANFEKQIAQQTAEHEVMIADARAKMAEAQKFAKQSARELIEDANQRREKMLADTKQQADQMKATILSEVEDEMKLRMEQIILHVLSNTVSKDVVRKSIETSLGAYKK